MNQNIADIGHLPADLILHFMRDFVRAQHSHLWIHFHVHFHKKKMTGFADKAFFHTLHAAHARRESPDSLDDFRVGRLVHQFAQRRTQQKPSVEADDNCAENRRRIVSPRKFSPANQRDADSDERARRRDRVTAMMPRVGLYGGIVRRFAFTDHKTEQTFLHGNHHDQHHQSEPFW